MNQKCSYSHDSEEHGLRENLQIQEMWQTKRLGLHGLCKPQKTSALGSSQLAFRSGAYCQVFQREGVSQVNPEVRQKAG